MGYGRRLPDKIETPRGVFVGEALDTFELDHQHVFDEEIGEVLSDALSLVSHCK